MIFASEWRGLARAGIRQGGTAVTEGVVQKLPPFAGCSRCPLDGATETVELAHNVIERRFDLPPERTATVGENQISRDPTEDCPRHHRGRYDSRVLFHALPPSK